VSPACSGAKGPPWSQLFIGVAVGCVVWQTFLAGYLFEEFATNYTLDRPPFCETSHLAPGSPRLRFRPSSTCPLLLYSLGVVCCGFVSGLIVYGLLRIVDRAWRPAAGGGGAAANGRAPAFSPDRRWPLLTGITLGVVASVGLAWLTFREESCARQASSGIGEWLVWQGGWGDSAGRDAAWKAVQGTGSTPESVEEARGSGRGEARQRLNPYFPVYGLFAINFFLFLVGFFGVLLFRRARRWFSPAIGILFLLHLIVTGSVISSYFIAAPHLFILGLALLAALGGLPRYKLQFPNLKDYYASPQSLKEFYEAQARQLALPSPPLSLSRLEERLVELERAERQRQNAGGDGGRNTEREEALAEVRSLRWQLTSHEEAAGGGGGAEPDGARLQLLLRCSRLEGEMCDRLGEKYLLHANDVQFRREGEPKKPVAVVCVSGSGSRAASWTIKVLTELEKEFTAKGVAFPYRIRLVTGASGGMIGAAYYVASLAEPDPANPGLVQREVTLDELNENIRKDFLTPVANCLVTRDLLSIFVPRPCEYDRGRALDDALKEGLNGQLEKTFDGLLEGERHGWRPSLVISPMLVEDGRQLLISNLDLAQVADNLGPILGSEGMLLSREAVEFFRIFPAARQFTVATAARMNATFPFVMPAIPVPTVPPRRVVDAG
jgi:hypothetical protein